MFPQRGVPPRISPGSSPKGALKSPLGGHSKVSPWTSRVPSKMALGAKKAPPKAPTPFFGQKGYLSKLELRERIRKLSPFILRGKVIGQRERVGMVEQWFPHKKFGACIKENEAKRRLRELRKQEYWAKPEEKKSLKFSRKLLEAFTGVRKY